MSKSEKSEGNKLSESGATSSLTSGIDFDSDSTHGWRLRALLEALPLPEKYLCETTRDWCQTSDQLSQSPSQSPCSSLCSDEGYPGSQVTQASSRSETLPTAHVSPHTAKIQSLASPTVSSSQDTIPRHVWDDSPIRRAASTEFSHMHIESGEKGSSNFKPDIFGTPARRWNSTQSLPRANPEYKELEADLNPTLDASQFRGLEESIYNRRDLRRLSDADLRLTRGQTTAACVEPTRVPEHQSHGLERLRHASPTSSHITSVSEQQHRTVDSTGNNMHYGYGPLSRDLFHGHSHKEPYRSHVGQGNFPLGSHTDRMGSYLSDPLHRPQSSLYNLDYEPHGYSHTVPSSILGNALQRDEFSNDLTSWQRRHQENLHRQRYEAIQREPSYAGSAIHSHVPSALNSLVDPHKLDAIRRAADCIIKEKDTIIEKQRVQIFELERHPQVADSDHLNRLKKAQEDADIFSSKLQDMQYENANLKAELRIGKGGGDSLHLEKKLGEREYQYEQLKITMGQKLTEKDLEIHQLKDKMAEQECLVTDTQQKYEAVCSSQNALQERVDSLERYFADQPTADEHGKTAAQVKSLKEEKSKYKSRIQELERRLTDANKAVKARDKAMEKLDQSIKDEEKKIVQIQEENEKLRQELQKNAESGAPTRPEEDIEEIQLENKRLKSDWEKAKKLLEASHRKLQALESRHKSEIKQLDERLNQEEANITALRQDLASKDQNLKKLRGSIKDLSAQNQDLMEKNMVSQDRLREMDKLTSGEAGKLERRLLKEMGVCFTELQALVQICIQRAEGQDPNISVLLGVKASHSHEAEEEQAVDKVQALKHKVSRVREMRRDIDHLREIISNKYAEDMGENLNCTSQ